MEIILRIYENMEEFHIILNENLNGNSHSIQLWSPLNVCYLIFNILSMIVELNIVKLDQKYILVSKTFRNRANKNWCVVILLYKKLSIYTPVHKNKTHLNKWYKQESGVWGITKINPSKMMIIKMRIVVMMMLKKKTEALFYCHVIIVCISSQ